MLTGATESESPFYDESGEGGHSFWLYAKKYWWTALFFTKRGAWSKVRADGWDAAAKAGNPYAHAKKMCAAYTSWLKHLKKHNQPAHPTYPGLRDYFCKIAHSTPSRHWVCYYITTTICFGAQGFDHPNGCNQGLGSTTRYWTAGPVEVTAWQSFYSNWGFRSEHKGVLVKGWGEFKHRKGP